MMRSRRVSGAPYECDGVLSAVAHETLTCSAEWFPEFAGRSVQTDLVASEYRPRCLLFRVALDDGRTQRRVVVKVRHSRPELRRIDRFEHRPVLAPERTMPDEDMARREYEGLRLIEQAFRAHECERFGVLRPLAHLPDYCAIIMAESWEPTLRQVLLARSRLRRGLLRRRVGADPWRNAGAWLRVFQAAPTVLPLTPRNSHRDSVVTLFREYGQFLAERVGDRSFFGDVADVAGERAMNGLPPELLLGVGHGDYVPRNIFVSSSGRVTVFDAAPRWRVSLYEDLARLVMAVRLLDVQAFTQGFAFGAEQLDGYEQAIVQGYFEGTAVPVDAVRIFQMLVLLDKWSDVVSKTSRKRSRKALQATSAQLLNRHFRREARRLLSLMEAGTPFVAVSEQTGTTRPHTGSRAC